MCKGNFRNRTYVQPFLWPLSINQDDRRTLSRLVVSESAIIGLTGSPAGAALGLGAATTFAGQAPGPLYLVAAVAVAGGVAVTAASAL